MDPHKHPDQLLGALCLMCRHYSPASEYPGRPSCTAFPSGIPDDIMFGKPPWHIPDPHFEPVPGQPNDVAFEKAESVTDEMVKEWNGFRGQFLISQWEDSAGVDLETMDESDPNEPIPDMF